MATGTKASTKKTVAKKGSAKTGSARVKPVKRPTGWLELGPAWVENTRPKGIVTVQERQTRKLKSV